MDSLRRVLNDEEDEESGGILGVSGNESLCPSMSWETRVKGFFACCGVGMIISIIGVIVVFFGNYVAFGLLYTMGTLTALASTFFLRGPVSQMKAMFKTTRLIATIVMFVMIVLTLCAAFWWKSGILCLIFCLLQFLAFTWYSLSYIPFARDAVKKCFGGCIS